jgi:heparin binding hemagglutinin HbhA
MTEPKTTRIPAPLYAAAGAGDLAYRQLRKLPAVAEELRGRATNNGTELREQVVQTATELRERAAAALKTANETAVRLRTSDREIERLREIALRNAAAFVAGAQVAQTRAVALYGELVARGERVVGAGVVQGADTVNADMEATEAPAALTSAGEPTKAAAAEAPAKKTVAKKTAAPKKSTT